MNLTELDSKLKRATRIDFNMNFPKITIYFKEEIDGEVFYASLGEYFENQKVAADLDIREAFYLTIFSIDTGDEIKSNKLDCIDLIGLDRLLNSQFKREKFLLGTGFIHKPSEASIPLTIIQHEVLFWIERLTIIKK